MIPDYSQSVKWCFVARHGGDFWPPGLTTEVKFVEMHHQSLPEALPSDNFGFNVKNIAMNDFKRGFITSNSKDDTTKDATNFTAQAIITHDPGQIRNGYAPALDCSFFHHLYPHPSCSPFPHLSYPLNSSPHPTQSTYSTSSNSSSSRVFSTSSIRVLRTATTIHTTTYPLTAIPSLPHISPMAHPRPL
ncbi:hypothetical protein PVL29_026041 [Vitis rotundifolia]|uniref:Uncharacterized protein n=1 Tax=Vitis rotundifolia TaxID=103349 RepID=A0AA38YLI1_VITRO|nr:hypothetical protein PVL29_026041 [Vitis rotundifolia]